MAKIAIFIDHDIMLRHFVLNGVLRPIWTSHEVVFVFPENHKRVAMDIHSLGLDQIRTVPVVNERMYLYRRLYHATVLRKMRRTTRSHRHATYQAWKDTLGLRAFLKSLICSWPGAYQIYKFLMLRKIGENQALAHFLNKECPDLVLHPTVLEGLFVSDLVRWSEQSGGTTVFIMNSWDNAATKAMMMGYPSRLVVWGEQSRQHAIRHMGMPPDRIVSLGVAQFDGYRTPPKESVDSFRQRHGIAPEKKVLLYAGSSKGLNETSHLLCLENAVENAEMRDCVILYRPHPWRVYPKGEADFHSLTWKHVRMESSMEACYKMSRQSSRMRIELANYEDTHVVLSSVDAVISPLSTILLEAALHGKPVAAYLPDEDMATNKFLSTVANMVHFQDFFERVECIKCERPEHLVRDCGQLLRLSDEAGICDRLREQCAYFVEPSGQPYADRLNDLIHSLLPGKA